MPLEAGVIAAGTAVMDGMVGVGNKDVVNSTVLWAHASYSRIGVGVGSHGYDMYFMDKNTRQYKQIKSVALPEDNLSGKPDFAGKHGYIYQRNASELVTPYYKR